MFDCGGGAVGLSLYNEQTTNKQKVMTAAKGKEIYINTTGTNLDLLLLFATILFIRPFLLFLNTLVAFDSAEFAP